MRHLLAVFLLCGCGGSNSSSPADMAQQASGDLAMQGSPLDMSMKPGVDLAGFDFAGVDLASGGLCCGQPGDVGNEKGVGKYCGGGASCPAGAPFCSSLGDPKTNFCTNLCSGATDTTTCGTNATCQCMGGQCGCFPNSCATMPAGC
jgi:hypothetical protein